jgi:hypothetical protein
METHVGALRSSSVSCADIKSLHDLYICSMYTTCISIRSRKLVCILLGVVRKRRELSQERLRGVRNSNFLTVHTVNSHFDTNWQLRQTEISWICNATSADSFVLIAGRPLSAMSFPASPPGNLRTTTEEHGRHYDSRTRQAGSLQHCRAEWNVQALQR